MTVMIDWKPMQSEVQTFVESIRPEFETKLKEWVEIPTVSAEPEHAPDMERLADAAVRYLKALGGEAEKVATPGYPVVVGRFMTSSDCPTVTIYNHLDVQPANEP